MPFMAAADALRSLYPDRRIPRFTMPNWAVRLYGLFDKDVRGASSELGSIKTLDSSAVIALLGRPLIPAPEAVRATAQSLMAHGIV